MIDTSGQVTTRSREPCKGGYFLDSGRQVTWMCGDPEQCPFFQHAAFVGCGSKRHEITPWINQRQYLVDSKRFNRSNSLDQRLC